jgi:hypothetical protein
LTMIVTMRMRMRMMMMMMMVMMDNFKSIKTNPIVLTIDDR